MRHAVWATMVAALFFAAPTRAQDAGNGQNDGEDETKPGAGMMEETGEDPANTEGFEQGAYSPKGKTGKLKDKELSEREAEEVAAKRRLEGLTAFAQVVIGFKEEPPLTATLPERDATSYTVLIGGQYFFTKQLGAGLRLPFSTARLGQPPFTDGSQTDTLGTTAFGSPELSATYRVITAQQSELPVTFAVGVPIAQGEPDPANADNPAKVEQTRVNRAADGAHGYREGELFTPAYLPITLTGAYRHFGTKLGAHAFLKLNLMPKIRGELSSTDFVPGGKVEQKGLVMRTVLGGGANYAILPERLRAGADLWFVYDFARPIEFTSSGGGSDLSRVQLAAEPKVDVELGAVKPYVGFLIPIGGELPMYAIRAGAQADVDF